MDEISQDASSIEENIATSEEQRSGTHENPVGDASSSGEFSKNEEISETSSGTEITADESQDRRSKPRIPSALTIENVRRYEEETDPVDVEELMAKAPPESSHDDESDARGRTDVSGSSQANLKLASEQPKDAAGQNYVSDKNFTSYDSPATTFVTRGLKFTGEEYEAVTTDVQTDESWLLQNHTLHMHESSEHPLKIFASRPSVAIAASDSSSTKPTGYSKKRHVTSDLSTSELVDSADEERLIPGMADIRESPLPSRTPTSKSPLPPFTSEEETDDENPVTEVNITESEYGELETTDNSISSVGPPYILQYKPESKAPIIDYENIQDIIPKNLDWDDLSLEEQEYYNGILNEVKLERKKREEESSASKNLIDIEPHAAYGSQQDRKVAKERAAERMRAREVERQKQTVSTNQTNFYAFARQLKTVNYSLSSDKCMEEGWTVRPVTPPTPARPAQEFFIQETGNDIVSGKRYHQTFVEKYYDNGQMFLAVFADGTGTVWYPSGNVAISIVSAEKSGRLIFIMQEDKDPDESPSLQAMFEPNGNCTCYYPNGKLRTILSPFGGDYFSQQGERIKRWKWKDTETHVHAPPFQPITFGLSRQIGIRIVSQESIHVTFTDGRRSVRFNVGTRLRLKQALPKIDSVDVDTVMLHERITYLQSLIERMHYTFKFPHSPRREQIKLPTYLTGKLERTARMRASLDAKLPPLKISAKKKQSPMAPPLASSTKFVQLKHRLPRNKTTSKIGGSLQVDPASDITFSVTVN